MILSINSLDSLLFGDEKVINSHLFKSLDNVNSLVSANEKSLVFIAPNSKHKESLLANTSAKVVICDFYVTDLGVVTDKCLVVVSDPKLHFSKVINRLLATTNDTMIHPTAVIHGDAEIGKHVSIGAHVSIGNSKIGNNCIIYPNVSIYDNVQIGDNVVIDSGAVIGAAGFGFVRDEKNIPVSFPQLGRVVIGNNVEIGANTCIDRGALSDTIIGDNTKIDNSVHISHNDVIGKNNYIMAHCVIAGSVTIGSNCWIAAERIMNKLSIGDNVFVGFGSQVLKDLDSDTTYMGVPAMEVSEYARLQYKLRKIKSK